jgi:hypothetical protein
MQKMRFPDGHRQRRIGPGQVRRFQVELRCPTGSRARNKDYGACEPTDAVDTTLACGQLPFASCGYHPFRQFGDLAGEQRNRHVNYAQEYGVHHVRMGYDSKGHLMSFAERGPLNPFSTIRHYSVCKVVEGVVGCFFVIPWHEESYRNVGVAGCAVGIFVL